MLGVAGGRARAAVAAERHRDALLREVLLVAAGVAGGLGPERVARGRAGGLPRPEGEVRTASSCSWLAKKSSRSPKHVNLEHCDALKVVFASYGCFIQAEMMYSDNKSEFDREI